jgi:hypothetical protein
VIRIQPGTGWFERFIISVRDDPSLLVAEVPAVATVFGNVSRPGCIGCTICVLQGDPIDADRPIRTNERCVLGLSPATTLAKSVVGEIAFGNITCGYIRTVRNIPFKKIR